MNFNFQKCSIEDKIFNTCETSHYFISKGVFNIYQHCTMHHYWLIISQGSSISSNTNVVKAGALESYRSSDNANKSSSIIRNTSIC